MPENISKTAKIHYSESSGAVYQMLADLLGVSVEEARAKADEYAYSHNPEIMALPEEERERAIQTGMVGFPSPKPSEPYSESDVNEQPAVPSMKTQGSIHNSIRRWAEVGGFDTGFVPDVDDNVILAKEKAASDPNLLPSQRDILLREVQEMRRQQDEAEAQAPAQESQTNVTQISPQTMPAAPAPFSVSPSGSFIGASMFNSPENLQRIADLLSKADSGQPIDEIMEDIRKSTGLEKDAFWAAISEMNKSAGENPFAESKEDKKDDSKDDKGEDKKDEKSDKKAPPFGKKEDKDEPKEDKKDEKKEEKKDDKPKAEPKKESKEPKADKAEPKSEPEEEEMESPEWEKRDIKVAKRAMDLLKKLMKREKEESKENDGELPQIEELKQAMELLEKFIKGEKEELNEMEMGMGDAIEKTGPDIPPALEGLALPMEEKHDGMDDMMGAKVLDMAPQAIPLAAALGARDLSTLTVGSFLQRLASSGTVEAQNAIDGICYIISSRSHRKAEQMDPATGNEPPPEVDAEKNMSKPEDQLEHKPMDVTVQPPHAPELPAANAPGEHCANCGNSLRENAGLCPDCSEPISEKQAVEHQALFESGVERSAHESHDACPACDDGSCKDCMAKKAPAKAAAFKLHDRVWRKADMSGMGETIGDEAGRIVDFGNGKAIVDWGHEDGIPTEEELSSLILAATAGAGENEIFALPSEAGIELEIVNPDRGPMANIEHVENVLRETSLFDILARQAKDSERNPDVVRHIASGKNGKILQRLAGGQYRVDVDGKELVLWPYEIE